jgi:hypothetical protein
LFYEFGKAVLDDVSPRASKNVTDEENVQRSRSQVLGVRSQGQQDRRRELAELSMLSRGIGAVWMAASYCISAVFKKL